MTYDGILDILEGELAVVAAAFDRLTPAQWRAATRLRPADPDRPPWTVLELAGHLEISIGITTMVEDRSPGDLGHDLAWVRAASGRTPHADPRLPLLN